MLVAEAYLSSSPSVAGQRGTRARSDLHLGSGSFGQASEPSCHRDDELLELLSAGTEKRLASRTRL